MKKGNRFKVICKRCGRKVQIVPYLYHANPWTIDRITLEVECKCGNKDSVTIYQ